jgi:hypothetical protein
MSIYRLSVKIQRFLQETNLSQTKREKEKWDQPWSRTKRTNPALAFYIIIFLLKGPSRWIRLECNAYHGLQHAGKTKVHMKENRSRFKLCLLEPSELLKLHKALPTLLLSDWSILFDCLFDREKKTEKLSWEKPFWLCLSETNTAFLFRRFFPKPRFFCLLLISPVVY